jgi:hypothetical protein
MPHLEEGMIHAWVEGALPPDEAALVEDHIAGCNECAAAVAEARGLIAASSRILTALDHVPSGVIPHRTPRARPWYMRRELQAAAALVIVAGTSLMLTRSGRQQEVAASKAALAVANVAMDTAPAATPAAADTFQPIESPKREVLQRNAAAAAAPPPSGRLLQKPAEQSTAQSAESVSLDAAKRRFDAAVGVASATVNAPPPKAVALAAPVQFAIDSLRVVKVERRIGTNGRITYEVSPGVQVVFMEEMPTMLSEVVIAPVAPKAQRSEMKRLGSAEKAKRESVSVTCAPDTSTQLVLRGVVTGVTTTSPAAPPATTDEGRQKAVPATLRNTLRWTDLEGSSHYSLTGPLTCDELKRVKARLPKERR